MTLTHAIPDSFARLTGYLEVLLRNQITTGRPRPRAKYFSSIASACSPSEIHKSRYFRPNSGGPVLGPYLEFGISKVDLPSQRMLEVGYGMENRSLGTQLAQNRREVERIRDR